MAEHCIVVKRGEFQQYDLLYKAFGARVPVIWDRRRQELKGATDEPDRRHITSPSWVALGFVVIER